MQYDSLFKNTQLAYINTIDSNYGEDKASLNE